MSDPESSVSLKTNFMPSIQMLLKDNNYEKLFDLNFESSLTLIDRSKLFIQLKF